MDEVTYYTLALSFMPEAGKNTPSYRIGSEMELSSSGVYPADDWIALGSMEPVKLTQGNFDELFPPIEGWSGNQSAARLRKKTAQAWSLVHEGTHYLLLQQKDGRLYLASGFYDAAEKNDPYSDDTNILCVFRLAKTEKTAP